MKQFDMFISLNRKLRPSSFDRIDVLGGSAKDLLMMWEDEQSPHAKE